MLNSRPAIVVYVESPRRPAAIAVPKYRPDCAAAAPRVPAAAFAAGITVTTPNAVTAATDPPISSRTRIDRLLWELVPGAEEFVATSASFSTPRHAGTATLSKQYFSVGFRKLSAAGELGRGPFTWGSTTSTRCRREERHAV